MSKHCMSCCYIIGMMLVMSDISSQIDTVVVISKIKNNGATRNERLDELLPIDID